MKVLVTGATGLIGCHAVAALLDSGAQVRVLVRDRERLRKALAPFGRSPGEVEIVEGAIETPDAVEAAMSGVEGLLHAAGRFSPDRRDADALHAINVEGTRRLLEVAAKAVEREQLSRIVYVSSILALFPPAGPTYDPEAPLPRPKEMYAATKAAAEAIARSAQENLPLSIVYPAAVQGPDDPTFSIGPQLVADALRSGRVLVTRGGLPTSDVRDLARLFAVLFGADRSPPRRLMAPAFFVPHDRYHALLEEITGRSLRAQRLPAALLRAMGWIGDGLGRLGRPVALTSEAVSVLTRSVPVDDEAARRLLGGDVHSAEASFRDLIAWMVAAGHLPAEAAGRIPADTPPAPRGRT